MDPIPPRISCRAYAKINLGLRVTGKRDDGYHEICTVFHRVALFDDIVMLPADGITVRTSNAEIPSGEGNICHAAALALRNRFNAQGGVRIDITKRVPAGAGLGGGSADAAAVLRSLPALWGKSLPADQLRELAVSLGSDVPFFLGDDTALGTGRGEILEYFRLDIPFALLLCTPPVRVSTRWAYSRVVPRPPAGEDLRSLLVRGMADPSLLRERLVNDFESPVIREHPVIGSIKESMMRNGSLFASMSGSGSTVYGFFHDTAAAGLASAPLESLGFATFITPPHFRV
ncbi:MAG TPA: 4-(cytidine 5'-diphospho)-2-C-methyl-D-erythritol kinase [Bacteroidota bacterium]|nr:4-(cytidine 5'-diphospho)-2-C-methyl-D-erythritol kinase [Bacteroidota bacterium]